MIFIYVKKFLCNIKGTTAIEYAVLGVVVAVTIAASVGLVGEETVDFFECVVEAFDGVTC